MSSTKTLWTSLAAISVAGLCVTSFTPSAFALDPGFGVGRPGPGVYRRAPVARAAVVRPVAPVARAAVVTPAAPVAAAVVTPAAPAAAAAVATPAAPVAAAAVATPATPAVAAAGCTVVVVNGARVRRCGAAAYRPAAYRPWVRGGRVVVVR
jgi:hypothetical protein